jgi:hypothetical protein
MKCAYGESLPSSEGGGVSEDGSAGLVEGSAK